MYTLRNCVRRYPKESRVLRKIRRFISIEQRILYYNAMIKQVMLYGSTIWSNCSADKGLCNNYLEGGWEMGEICPKTKSYPPLIKHKLISTSPHKRIILWLTAPKKSLLPSIPSYLVYLLDFFLWYKNHFKWLFAVCRKVIWRVIRITGLWACVVFAWIGRFLIFYSISGTRVPARAWVRTQEFLSDWPFFWSSI